MSETVIVENSYAEVPTGLLEVINDLQLWASRETYARSDNITLDVYGVERRRAVREVMARIAREELAFLFFGITLLYAVQKHLIFPFAGAVSHRLLAEILSAICLLAPPFVPPLVLCWGSLRATGTVSVFIARYATQIRAVWLIGCAFFLSFFLYEILPTLGVVELFYERLPTLGPIPVAEWLEIVARIGKAASPEIFAAAALSALLPVVVAQIRSTQIEKRKKLVEEIKGSL